MPVMMPVSQIELAAGSMIMLRNVSWRAFEAVLRELKESRVTRVAYSNNTLEIMAPLPEHERTKILMADVVKAILRFQQRDWEPLGSTTFKQLGAAGVEPDECFYIQNYRAVIGKGRIDLSVDPPPDLAIESDVTSKTRTEAYVAIGVPELWIYDAGELVIYVLKAGEYQAAPSSLVFPGLPIADLVAQVIQRAGEIGSSRALRELEQGLHK